MNYLKSYGVFESASVLREEVKELLANLEDDGFIVTFSYMGEDNGYIYIRKSGNSKKVQFFDASEVSGDIIRMCRFLEDRYLCDVGILGSGSMLNIKSITIEQLQERKLKLCAIKINLFSKKDD